MSARTRQPQVAVRIDPAYAYGLAELSFQSRSLLNGSAWSTFGTAPTYDAGPQGLRVNASAAFGGLYRTPLINCATAEQTQLFYGEAYSYTGAYSGLIVCSTANGATGSLALQRNALSDGWTLYNQNSISALTGDPITDVRPVGVVITTFGGRAMVYVNGVEWGNFAATATAQADSRIVTFGERSINAGYATKGVCYLRGAWARGFPSAIAREISRNPWSLFASRQKPWIQLGAASGGATDVTGTLAATDGADAASFTGAERFTGTLAATDGADSAAFTGAERFTGALAATDGADTAAFTGSHTEAGITSGTLAATDGADIAAFTGTHTAPTVTGTLAATEGADAATFTGIFLPNITGTLAAVDGADGAAFTGSAASAVTGTLDATDGADTAEFLSETIGGRPIRRSRRKYLVRDRVYDDLDPADLIAAAAEAGVELDDVRVVVKDPPRQKAAPRRADDDGREYWLPQEFWGRAAARQRTEATSPLGPDFYAAMDVLARPGASFDQLPDLRLRERQEREAMILLLA